MEQEKLANIRRIWSKNAFVNLLKVKIDDVTEGKSRISLTIDPEVHTNHWLGLHGGVLATMADVNAGLIGASFGKVLLTVNFNINYVGKSRGEGLIIAEGETIHHGKTTMVIRSKIKDDMGRLLCEASLVMLVAGELKDLNL